MDKLNVMELEHTIEYVNKKLKLAKAQLETMKNDDIFNNQDLWLLATSLRSVFSTELDNLSEKFDIK